MAAHYYGVNLGDEMPSEVTVGTSTTSKTVELVITDAVAGTTKLAVIKAIDTLKAYLTRDSAPA